MPLLSLDRWIQRTRALVQTEHAEERTAELEVLQNAGSEQLQELGLRLARLEVDSVHSGLFGQTLIGLKRRAGIPLPANSQFSTRDAVLLRWSGQKAEARGVIHQIQDAGRLTVSFHTSSSSDAGGQDGSLLQEEVEAHSGSLVLLKVADEVTFKLYEQTLEQLEQHSAGRRSLPSADLLEVLHGSKVPKTPVPEILFQPINENLNPPQLRAIRRALGSPELHLIHGPPGTGKTTTLVELILQAVQRGERVLACAPSNIAVDNIVEGLAKYSQLPLRRQSSSSSKSDPQSSADGVVDETPVKICRVGHPARLMTSILEHSLDEVIRRSDDARIVSDIRNEIESVRAALSSRRGKRKPQEPSLQVSSSASGAEFKDFSPAQLKQRLWELRKDLRSRSKTVISNALSNCDVVLCTLTGADRLRTKNKFDLVVIDEAAQALEIACYVPLCRSGSKLILAGDHQQLPPVVKSQKAEALTETLFSRVHGVYPGIASMLTMQYRMHQTIMEWSSQQFYGGKLEAHSSVAEHLLQDLPTLRLRSPSESAPSAADIEWDAPIKSSDTVWGAPLWVWDTAGCAMWEQDTERSTKTISTDVSHSNTSEAEVVIKHLQALLEGGVPQKDVAVISPYAGQVRLLRQMTHAFPDVEIGTVDGFQGREKEAIIMSFVRSNEDSEIGFLKDSRRINVAITRARRHLVLIGDSGTLCNDAKLDSLIDFATEHGEYHSAEELQPQPTEVTPDPAPVAGVSNKPSQVAEEKANQPSPPEISSEPPVESVPEQPKSAADSPKGLEESRQDKLEQSEEGGGKSAVASSDEDFVPEETTPETVSSAAVAPEDWLVLRKEYSKARILADLKAFKRQVERKRASFIRRDAVERRSTPPSDSGPSNETVAVRRQRELHEDPELVLTFPAFLSSFQRQQVHSLSESLGGFWHRSQNVGLDRQVQVRPGSPDGDNGDGDPRRRQEAMSGPGTAVRTGRRPGRSNRGRERRNLDPQSDRVVRSFESTFGGGTELEHSNRSLGKPLGGSPNPRSPISILQQLNSATKPNVQELLRKPRRQKGPKKLESTANTAPGRSEQGADVSPSQTLDLFDPVPEGYFSFKSLGDDPDADHPRDGAAVDAPLQQQSVATPRKKKKGKKRRPASKQNDGGMNVQSNNNKQSVVASSLKKSDKVGEVKAADDDDDDAIFAEFRPGKCCRVGCKKSVKFTGSICPYCKEIYCVTHMNAFEHGCALEAGRHARQKMAVQHGYAPSNKKMDGSKRAYLQRKLAEKAQKLRSGPESKGKKKSKKGKKKK